MGYIQRHYKMLLVSDEDSFIKEVRDLLRGDQCQPDDSPTASDARSKLHESPYDIVIINAPLKDESAARLCMDVGQSNGTIAAVFAEDDAFEEIYAKVSSQGVFVLHKPSSRKLLSQALYLMMCARERVRNLEKKVGKTESKLDEVRIVNRAKWMLIDREGLSEADAHRRIEKSAMDAGITKKLAAQMILDNYLK